jgi:hypothetical protein
MSDAEDVHRWLLARLYRALWRMKLANSEAARLQARADQLRRNADTGDN